MAQGLRRDLIDGKPRVVATSLELGVLPVVDRSEPTRLDGLSSTCSTLGRSSSGRSDMPNAS
jgi:hypothetical protein